MKTNIMEYRTVFVFIFLVVFHLSEPNKDVQNMIQRIEQLEKTQQKWIDIVKQQEVEIHSLRLDASRKSGTDTTKRLAISNSSSVAFSAYLNHVLANLSPGAIVPFEKVTTNEGNAFHGASGLFTCPRSGLYMFVWTLAVDNGHTTQVNFIVNGNTRRWAYSTANSGFISSSNHDIVRLAEGDRVWMANERTSGEIHPHHTTFSGVFLTQ